MDRSTRLAAHFRVWAAAFLVCGWGQGQAMAQDAGARSVVIFTSDEREARVSDVAQALAFWNSTFAGLGLQRPFLDPQVVIRAPVARALETYAYRVSRDGWRLGAGAEELKAPAAVTSLDGDVLLLLSTERILPFAWPIGGGAARYFLAIRTDRIPPLDGPGAARNVAAHELGHTLGLTHNGDAGMLMCASCDMSRPAPGESPFLTLSPDDRAKLLALHPRLP